VAGAVSCTGSWQRHGICSRTQGQRCESRGPGPATQGRKSESLDDRSATRGQGSETPRPVSATPGLRSESQAPGLATQRQHSESRFYGPRFSGFTAAASISALSKARTSEPSITLDFASRVARANSATWFCDRSSVARCSAVSSRA